MKFVVGLCALGPIYQGSRDNAFRGRVLLPSINRAAALDLPQKRAILQQPPPQRTSRETLLLTSRLSPLCNRRLCSSGNPLSTCLQSWHHPYSSATATLCTARARPRRWHRRQSALAHHHHRREARMRSPTEKRSPRPSQPLNSDSPHDRRDRILCCGDVRTPKKAGGPCSLRTPDRGATIGGGNKEEAIKRFVYAHPAPLRP